jgi:hypothetical protein
MRKRKSRYARNRSALTDAQELNLIIGGPSAFKNDQGRRQAWFRHREEILSLSNDPYPDARICFELGGYLPGERKISQVLARLGIAQK